MQIELNFNFQRTVSIIIIMKLTYRQNSISEDFDDKLINLFTKFGNLLSTYYVIQSALDKYHQIQFYFPI